MGPSLFQSRFKNYYNRFPGVKQSLHFLQDVNPDVEALFEEEWKNISRESNQEVLSRHMNIQYYLQEVLKDVTHRVTQNFYEQNLYVKLANRLQKIYSGSKKHNFGRPSFQKFAFVSFNQDTILETFLSEQFGLKFSSLDDYVNVNNSPLCVFKPHGSWNWGWQFPNVTEFNGNTSGWLFEHKINFFELYFKLLGDHIKMIDWSTSGVEASINAHGLGKYTIDKSQLQIIGDENLNYFYPALLLPYRDKDEFTMPLRHFLNMEDYLGYVETLVIIGWKGNEAAFNRLLLRGADKIKKVIIADPQYKQVEENLKDLLLKLNITPIIYEGGFEDFVQNGIDKELNKPV